ncbi:MAG TPA: hypothetical protein VLM88_07135 [Proteiniclasticum sp.]|nr:hypothetical protein [Proteiniclasticum sp.]
MNKRFGIFFKVVIICSFTGFMLSACKENVHPKIEQKVIFIQQYINYASGYQNNGYYIDNEGNVIEFDLSEEGEQYADQLEMIGYFEKQENQIIKKTISQNEISKYYEYLYKIDSNAELIKKSVGADMGANSIFGIAYTKEGTLRIITIDSTGDWEVKNTDKYAQKINDWLR